MAGSNSVLYNSRIRNIVERSFQCGVQSVLPHNAIKKNVKRDGDSIVIQYETFTLKDTYIVGFGKAVAGMVKPLLKTLEGMEHYSLKKGILSVPVGYRESVPPTALCDLDPSFPIEMYEGAENNLPDESSARAAIQILNLAKDLSADDTLFVLISGGGSALFPVPISGLTLSEKASVTKQLSKAGATIHELNTVRKCLSAVKGGKLALCTKARVISLIISDVIGDNLDVIASGPTALNTDSIGDFIKIINKYDIAISPAVLSLVDIAPYNASAATRPNFEHVSNFLIGSNSVALAEVGDYMITQHKLPTTPILLSRELQGEASLIGGLMATLGFNILDYIDSKINMANATDRYVTGICEDLGITNVNITRLMNVLDDKQHWRKRSMCLIFGGETTVAVKAGGKGGRNQELILAASLKFKELSETKQPTGNLYLLSGGTDGIDGPTDVAGAQTYYTKLSNSTVRLQTTEATEQQLDPAECLAYNNSYEYFRLLGNGNYHLKYGHTGTNVMDIVILFISLADMEQTS